MGFERLDEVNPVRQLSTIEEFYADVMSTRAALAEVWSVLGGPAAALGGVVLTGQPMLAGPFPIASAAAATLGASHLAAVEYGRARGLDIGDVHLSLREAAAAFRSERYLEVDGAPPVDPWSPLSGYYEANDGWVQLHTNYDHHRNAVLRITGTSADRPAVAAVLGRRSRFEVENDVLAAGGCAFALRSHDEWMATSQAAALSEIAAVTITPQSIDNGPEVRIVPAAGRPLDGVRVLDLTHVIAGPTAGRTLAAYGASVIRVSAAHLPTIATLDVDTGFGKTWRRLDLRTAADREAFLALVGGSDVVLQGFRPGSFEALGVGPDDLLATRPGLVVVTLSAWSHVGPWSDRRGFDSLVQTATGIAYEGGRARSTSSPVPLPAQALDHATGYLMAAAAIRALTDRYSQGHGAHVQCALACTGAWLWSLPRTPVELPDLTIGDVSDLRIVSDTPYGRAHHLGPVGSIVGVRLGWDIPPPARPW